MAFCSYLLEPIRKLDMYIFKVTLSRIYAFQIRSDKCHTVYSFHCNEATRHTSKTAHRRGTESNLDRSRTDVFTAANCLQLGNIRFVTILSDTFIINIVIPTLYYIYAYHFNQNMRWTWNGAHIPATLQDEYWGWGSPGMGLLWPMELCERNLEEGLL